MKDRKWIVLASGEEKIPAFYRSRVRVIGVASLQESPENISVTYAVDATEDLRELVAEISDELRGRVVGVHADATDVSIMVGERGGISETTQSVIDVTGRHAAASRKEPEYVKAARLALEELGLGFSSEEMYGLPPGGWGLAKTHVGRGRIRLPEGWVNQERERFVLGPGEDETGASFFGIWDRESPSRPILRFLEEERGMALTEYSKLRNARSTRPDKPSR